jgi:hypothetical protein
MDLFIQIWLTLLILAITYRLIFSQKAMNAEHGRVNPPISYTAGNMDEKRGQVIQFSENTANGLSILNPAYMATNVPKLVHPIVCRNDKYILAETQKIKNEEIFGYMVISIKGDSDFIAQAGLNVKVKVRFGKADPYERLTVSKQHIQPIIFENGYYMVSNTKETDPYKVIGYAMVTKTFV